MAAELCERFWQLDDPASSAIAPIARECAGHASSATTFIEAIKSVAHDAREASNEGQVAAMWALIDQLCKSHEAFVEALRPLVVDMAEKFPVSRSSDHFVRFSDIMTGFKAIFGNAVVSLISIKLRGLLSSGPTSAPNAEAATTIPQAQAIRAAALQAEAAAAKQGQLSTTVRTVGGFQMQRANNSRPMGAQNALMVKTRDSLQAVRGAALYAPARPDELPMAMPERDSDAPSGYMQALPANYQEQYIEARKKRWREMAAKRQEADERKRAQPPAPGPSSSAAAQKVDLYEDIVMPEELPRDEFGIKIANYPAGVRFLKEAIKACGEALELSVIEERVSQMTDREAQAEIGNLRQFIHIHAPTFRVSSENNQWVVRLTEDPDPERPDPNAPYEWEYMECPMCSMKLKGRNYPKHVNNRKCITTQIAKGLRGTPFGPVGDLAYAARTVIDSCERKTLDDDDVSHFARCVHAAAKVSRLSVASQNEFLPIVKGLRCVRDFWLESKGVSDMADAPVSEVDGPYAALFAAFGMNLRRLPITWIDTGDIIDMAKRFSTQLLPAHAPVPRAGDPRIRVGNPYPGMMFAESDTDPDDMPSGADDEFSDDEEALFEFAPPVSVIETVMAVGIPRETKRLNFRLRTAPPIPATSAIKSDGSKTVGQLYKAQKDAA